MKKCKSIINNLCHSEQWRTICEQTDGSAIFNCEKHKLISYGRLLCNNIYKTRANNHKDFKNKISIVPYYVHFMGNFKNKYLIICSYLSELIEWDRGNILNEALRSWGLPGWLWERRILSLPLAVSLPVPNLESSRPQNNISTPIRRGGDGVQNRDGVPFCPLDIGPAACILTRCNADSVGIHPGRSTKRKQSRTRGPAHVRGSPISRTDRHSAKLKILCKTEYRIVTDENEGELGHSSELKHYGTGGLAQAAINSIRVIDTRSANTWFIKACEENHTLASVSRLNFTGPKIPTDHQVQVCHSSRLADCAPSLSFSPGSAFGARGLMARCHVVLFPGKPP